MDVLIGMDVELKTESIKHELNLLNCKTEKEAAAEVTWHFAREFFIRQKYEQHHLDIQTHGIVVKDGMKMEV